MTVRKTTIAVVIGIGIGLFAGWVFGVNDFSEAVLGIFGVVIGAIVVIFVAGEDRTAAATQAEKDRTAAADQQARDLRLEQLDKLRSAFDLFEAKTTAMYIWRHDYADEHGTFPIVPHTEEVRKDWVTAHNGLATATSAEFDPVLNDVIEAYMKHTEDFLFYEPDDLPSDRPMTEEEKKQLRDEDLRLKAEAQRSLKLEVDESLKKARAETTAA